MAEVPSPTIGRHQMETLIIERVWKDPEFKREFTTNHKGTIEKYSGQKLPADVKILVHEEDAKTMHLTIPAPPPNLSELSDDELEKVAGGTDVAITAAIITVISGLVAASISVANDQTRARAGW
jgi:hypothetical protein